MDDNGWKALFAGICAIIFFSFVAFSFSGMLTTLGNGATFQIGNLFVQAGVLLSKSGTATGAFDWPPGTYSACTISTTSTNCLDTHITSQPVYSPFLILFSIIAVFFAIVMLLLFVKKSYED